MIKSIIPLIEAKYNSYTDIEKTIADFFLKNTKKLDFSSKNISSKLFVSEASLSRFAKKCGFAGYREFIYEYKESIKEREVSGVPKTVFDTYQDILNKTYSLMDESQIARVVNLIKCVSRIVVCGKGSSGLAASEMESRFMRIGMDIDSLIDEDRMRMQSVFLNEKSLVFGFTLSGTTPSVLYLLREAYARGAKTILLTANDDAHFKTYCDEVILVSATRNLHYGNILSPQLPILIILDIIYNELVNSDRIIAVAMHGDTLRALQGKEAVNETE